MDVRALGGEINLKKTAAKHEEHYNSRAKSGSWSGLSIYLSSKSASCLSVMLLNRDQHIYSNEYEVMNARTVPEASAWAYDASVLVAKLVRVPSLVHLLPRIFWRASCVSIPRKCQAMYRIEL